jgi:hypothetical protein
MKYTPLLLLLSFSAFADGGHGSTHSTINNYTEIVNKYADNCKGKALSAAHGNNQIAYGVRTPQLSIGGGYCGGDSAVSLMLGGRFCDKCNLVNGSIGYDGEDAVLGAGILILF